MTPVFGEDARVSEWAFRTWGCRPFHVDMAVGLADDRGELIGAFAFSGYNGSDAEIHVLMPGLLTRRVVRLIMTIAILQFNLNRLTVRTRKESMARGVQKLGAVYEGTIRRMYGPTDDDSDAGRQYAFFRETIEKLARWSRPSLGRPRRNIASSDCASAYTLIHGQLDDGVKASPV